MKTFLLPIILLFITSFSYADCAGSGLSFWPQSKTVMQNSIFVIEGSEMSREIIEDIGTKTNVFLTSKKHNVQLKVVEVLEGNFRLKQVVLRPEEQLIAGEHYVLHIEGINEEDGSGVSQWNSESGKHELVSWIVEQGSDTNIPSFISKPSYLGGSYTGFGCGPAIYSLFGFKAKDTSPLLVRTQVKDVETGAVAVYLLPYEDGRVTVGHGMCSGAFNIEIEKQYEV